MLPNFCTCHSHPQSLDSGSTVEDMAKREVELGTGSFTMTDHGTLGVARQVYDLAKKHKLKPILGLEGYVRDDDCAILAAGGIAKNADGNTMDYAKYYHITMHALSQAAYERMVRVLTRADLEQGEQHGIERKPIFRWRDLEEMLQDEMTVGSGCLVGMVQKHLMEGRPDLAVAYYEKLRGIVKPGNFYVEVFPHRCDQYWDKAIYLTINGEERRYHFGKWLRVSFDDKVEELQAFELSDRSKKWKALTGPETRLLATRRFQTWTDEPRELSGGLNFPRIEKVREQEGFLQNECTPYAPDGDLQKSANRFMLKMALKYKDPILISDDSHFARPDDKIIQDLRLLSGESYKTKGSAPAWRFWGSYHRQSSDEAFEYFKSALGVPEGVFRKWVENSFAWRDRFGWKFVDRKQLPTKFYPSDTLGHTMKLIREVGRMDYKDEAKTNRLKAEIALLHKNGVMDFLPYFFMGQEAVALYERLGKLTGPGRGSAAGLLLAYLLGITHVNPLKYGLSKERFMTMSRIISGKLPDIDQDFGGGEARDAVIAWLKERFGDHQAQISTDAKMRLKTSIQDAHRMLDKEVSAEVWSYTNKMAQPPMGITDHDFVFGYKDADGNPVKGSIETDSALVGYIKRFPTHWAIVAKALGVVRQKGRHASAWVIMNEPIANCIPMTLVNKVPVTSYTMKAVESTGGIKMDFLGVNSLNDIELALKLIQKRAGYAPQDRLVNGVRVPGFRIVPQMVTPPTQHDEAEWAYYDVWDLPEDVEVFRDVCDGKTETVFQFNTSSAQTWFKAFRRADGSPALDSVEDLATFTALDRPGGLDAFVETEEGVKRNMLEEFAARSAGKPSCKNRMAILDELFPETFGVLTYQEQLQKAFQVIGGTTAEEGDEFRVHVSKKMNDKVMKDKAVFMKGAVERLGQVEAERLWGMMETFANYGFNKSHAVCYALVGYVCAWLKHHYPLEWWTAVLSNASRNEIDQTFWPHCGHLVDPPDVRLSGDGFEIQGDRIRAPMGLLAGVGPKAHEELVKGKPYTDLRDFLERIKATKAAGRTALGKAVIYKLIIAGAMDSFFADPGGATVYDKLCEYAHRQAEVDNIRYKKTNFLKMELPDERFKTLTPLQRYLLRKSILASHTEDLQALLLASGSAPEEMRGGTWDGDPIVGAAKLKSMLAGEVERPDKDAVAIIAYVSASKAFWNGKALKIDFEMGAERFKMNMWPRRLYDDDGHPCGSTPATMPTGAEGGVCVLRVARWRADKEYTIEQVSVVAAPFNFKDD